MFRLIEDSGSSTLCYLKVMERDGAMDPSTNRGFVFFILRRENLGFEGLSSWTHYLVAIQFIYCKVET